jgi:Rrf2 family nitric oxide-sensitive transcriptional repressor
MHNKRADPDPSLIGRPSMKLTRYTDYALRVMIHLGLHDQGLESISEIARAYGISHNHLMKVVQDLGSAGYVETLRGRSGGIRLARPPAEINIGQLVRHTEQDFALVDCSSCTIAPACTLKGALAEATRAFLAVLDGYTVADLLHRPTQLRELLSISPRPVAPVRAPL